MNSCYSYSFEEAKWTKADELMLTREGARSILLDDGSLWVTGGRAGTALQSTTEVFREDSLTQGRSLPYRTAFHCLVSLNETHAFVGGGYSEGPFEEDARGFVIDKATTSWTGVGSLESRRHGHVCAVIDDPPRVVVAGGFTYDDKVRLYDLTTEILDLETLTWSAGPETPGGRRLSSSVSVPFGDSFVVVGGDTFDSQRRVHQFDPVNMTWIKREETLQNDRSNHAAFIVPNSICQRE